MSNKAWNKLSRIDQRLQRLFPTEMWNNNETICTIRMFGGFEFFNDRPYHNYENWSEGYEIESGTRFGSIRVTAEDLDDAVAKMERALAAWKESQKPNASVASPDSSPEGQEQ